MVDPKKVFEVIAKGWMIMVDDWKREPSCKLLRYAHCTNVDPQDCLCGVICPVAQPRLHPPSGIEARMKGGNN